MSVETAPREVARGPRQITLADIPRWMRWVIPGFAELMFFGLLVTLTEPRMYSDGDTGWHLWAGFEMLRHGVHRIPDTLTFSLPGAPWRDVQWLADVLFALAWRHGGYLAAMLLPAFAFAGTFTWMYRSVLAEVDHPLAAFGATVLAAFAAAVQLLVRPLVFTFPLMFAAWQVARKPARGRTAVWLFPLLTALWSNLHPTAFLLPGLALFVAVMRPAERRSYAVACVLSLVALGATPWGYGWLSEVLPSGAGAPLLKRIDEWQAPRFSELRYAGTYVILLVALAARLAGPRLTAMEAVTGLACLAGALRAARLGPLAALIWAPWLARDLAAWARTGAGAPGRAWRSARDTLLPFERAWRPGLWPALTIVVGLLGAPWIAPRFPKLAHGFAADQFPERAVARAEALHLGPRVLVNYGWGGWMEWVYGGRWKTFVDGRAGFFARDSILSDYLAVLDVSPGWERALARRRPDWLLFGHETPLVAAAPATGRWRIAYQDSLAVLLVPVSAPAPPPPR
jgi:hypothetical protein